MVCTVLWMILILVLFLILFWIGYSFYQTRKKFLLRYEGPGDKLSAFPAIAAEHTGWSRRKIEFQSQESNTLRGFLMQYPQNPKALLIVYHGYGMSLEDYLPECEYFCRRGYLVLAFDGSGTGYSDGILGSLPRHISDLIACLNYIQADEELNRLPLLLFGHSWGGYACNSVSALGRWPIRGIISAAGFASADAALYDYTKRHYGIFTPITMAGVRLGLWACAGRLAGINSADGLKKVCCPVLIAQSTDDPIIDFHENLGKLQKIFSNDPKKQFLELSGKGHNITVPRDVDRRKRKLVKQLHESSEPLDSPNNAKKLQEFFTLQKETDTELLKTFADFLDSCLENEP